MCEMGCSGKPKIKFPELHNNFAHNDSMILPSQGDGSIMLMRGLFGRGKAVKFDRKFVGAQHRAVFEKNMLKASNN